MVMDTRPFTIVSLQKKTHMDIAIRMPAKCIVILKRILAMTDKIQIPKDPPEDLLLSMAIRYDHGLAIPGYYDQPLLKSAISHKERLESTIRTMRQLYEEVSGEGFYEWGSGE